MGIERGRSLGMPVDEFTEKAYAGLASGKEEVIIGHLHGISAEATQELLEKRNELFNTLSSALAVHFHP